jgi:hypothetical protein
MEHRTYTEQDAWSLAAKVAAFWDTLSPGEQAAWEALEGVIRTLTSSDEADVQGYAFTPDQIVMMGKAHTDELRAQAAAMARASEAARGAAPATGEVGERQSLWFRLVSGLRPLPRAASDATPG